MSSSKKTNRRDGSRSSALSPIRRPFQYEGAELKCAGVALEPLARRYGTPLYVYHWETIAASFAQYRQAFAARPHLICASVKANGNLSLLHGLAHLGSGFDIVSGGELQRVLAAGGDAGKVVFSGVGKTAEEMDAALDAGILLFNVESAPELKLLAERARRKRVRARFGIRVNPDVEASTHPYIATGLHRHKFGVTAAAAEKLYREYSRHPWLEAAALSFHIGSQILDTAPFGEAVAKMVQFIRTLRAHGVGLRYFDLGGGLGIAYHQGQKPPAVNAYAATIHKALGDLGCTLLLEPGRRLMASAGALLTRVLYVKDNEQRHFVIADAGFNDLIRPVLYSAHHEIAPVQRRKGSLTVDVVGPICESSDAFARERKLSRVQSGDLLAILDAGAYGFSIASNYNSRPRVAEVLLKGGKPRLIRRRERLDELFEAERECLPKDRSPR